MLIKIFQITGRGAILERQSYLCLFWQYSIFKDVQFLENCRSLHPYSFILQEEEHYNDLHSTLLYILNTLRDITH